MSTPPPSPSPKPRRGLRAKIQPVGMLLMGIGYFMMFQSLAQVLFSYSFIVILVGTLTFIISNWLPE